MKKKMILSLIAVISLCSCNDISGTWYTVVADNKDIVTTSNTSVNPFNTVMNLQYFINDEYGLNEDETMQKITDVFDKKISSLHKNFDRHYYYKDYELANVKTINDSFATGKEVKVSDELYTLLKDGVESYSLTNGQFNIFTGALTDYWDNVFSEVYNYVELDKIDPYFNENQRIKLETIVDSIPSNADEISKQLTFDDKNKTIKFNKCDFNNDQRIIISVGGIAKGYATDLIKEELKNNNYKDGYIVSGGSSISTIDKPIFTNKEKGHKISVIDPIKSNIVEKEIAFSMKFDTEFSFSTSGNYTTNKSYSFLDKDGNRIYRHHIINPFTGYPESYHHSVSVMTNYFSNAMVDTFSTAFMNLSVEDGLKLRREILNKYEECNLELFYIEPNGKDGIKVVSTSNMNNTFKVAKGVEVIYEE